MEKAKVYYCDMHTGRMNLPEKLKFLMKKAGFEEIDFKKQIHCYQSTFRRTR